MSKGHHDHYITHIPTGEVAQHQVLEICLRTLDELGWPREITAAEKIQVETIDGEHFTLSVTNNTLSLSSGTMTVGEGGVGANVNLALFQQVFETQLAQTIAAEKDHGEIAEINPLEASMSKGLDDANEGSLWRLLLPNKNFFVTPLIADACIVIFIIMTIMGANFFDPSSSTLIKWGGNYSPLTLGGQWWRLISAVFVHVGIMHIAFNLFGLIFVAVFVEPIVGKWRFFVAYMVTGVLASVASIWWHTVILSAGASGAIMGIYGLFIALLASDLLTREFRSTGLIYFGVIIAFNLLSGMKDGIDNAAHIGGLVSGFIIGYLYYPSLKKPDNMLLHYGTPLLVLLLGGGIACYAVKHIPNYIAIYDSKMREFDNNKLTALKIFDMPDSINKPQMLVQIDSQGIQLWEKNLKLLDDLNKIPKLPEELEKEIDQLRVYSQLRKKDFQLEYKRIDEGTATYDDSLTLLEHQIDSVLSAKRVSDSLARKVN